MFLPTLLYSNIYYTKPTIDSGVQRWGGGVGGFKHPTLAEKPKTLQNLAKLNPIVKNV